MELVRSAVTTVPTCCFLNSSQSLKPFPTMEHRATGQQSLGGLKRYRERAEDNVVALDSSSIV